MYRSAKLLVHGPGGNVKINCQRSIEGEKGKKKKKKKKRKRRKNKKRGRRKKYLAPSSPARCRRPRPRAIFLLCEETERLPVRGERSRQLQPFAFFCSAQLLQMEEIDYNDLVNCVSTLNEIGNNKILDLETRDAPMKGSLIL
ncbi:hypothetical protein GW17_00033088 [Ensete ventricosum]|nr:hypothetical protein GW17_00033088 [Ensete ventricosum]